MRRDPQHDALDGALPDDAATRLEGIARHLLAHPGPIVVLSHVDPDGDAVGSVVCAARALRRLGKEVVPIVTPPRFLTFLAEPGELHAPCEALPPGALALVLDCDLSRVTGAPLQGATSIVNLDHHPGNPGDADLHLVLPQLAATAVLMKHLIDALGLEWDAALATPCLCGILTDTGTFRYANTDRHTLAVAGDLIEAGVAYAELTDRLQWRHPDYFARLSTVLSTVRYAFDGALVTIHQSRAMRAASPASDDDSDDFVGLIRYAEGTLVAAYLREVDEGVKVSLRSRGGFSARRVCEVLNGGGHEVAAGARLRGLDLAEAETRLHDAVATELARLRAA